MLKYYILIFFFYYFSPLAAQDFVYIDSDNDKADFTIKIADKITFPDIQVVLARNIPFSDFSVGITPYRNQAHYIITKKQSDANRHIMIDNCSAFPDLSILVKDDLSFPDVRIEFRDASNFVDILIYSEKTTVSEQELIACLLPLIREKAQK